ncbi:hypothetical protein B566_EDAN016833 [Ephemera danica]|nr:hypothetical protein B566_EDAN016833 [Ephemera danica]
MAANTQGVDILSTIGMLPMFFRNKKRERGNWWYQREEHSLAIQCYRKALEYLDEAEGGITMESAEKPEGTSPDLLLLIEDRLKVYNNLAAAQMKIKAFDAALQSVENVLRCQPKNVKALFRKGKILAEKGDNEQAVEVLRVANKLEPENKVIHQELGRVVARSRQDRSEEKSLYRRMFGQEKPSPATSDEVDKPSVSVVHTLKYLSSLYRTNSVSQIVIRY